MILIEFIGINPTISTSNLRAVGFFCILNRFPCCLTGLYYKYMLNDAQKLQYTYRTGQSRQCWLKGLKGKKVSARSACQSSDCQSILKQSCYANLARQEVKLLLFLGQLGQSGKLDNFENLASWISLAKHVYINSLIVRLGLSQNARPTEQVIPLKSAQPV